MAECGVLLPMETDLRVIFYLSDKAEDRNNKLKAAKANQMTKKMLRPGMR